MSTNGVTPVFLLSAPRSGSTLVQRVLAAHDGVATTSEPWLLLPLLSPLADHLPQRDFFAAETHNAIVDFTEALPQGKQSYRDAIRAAALELYAQVGGPDTRFFVDKTPPYSILVDEIVETFPGGRLVFLWRHPLSIVSSVVETFAGGRWRPSDYPLSLFWGPAALADAFARHRDRSFGVRYEDLVAGGERTWQALGEYVGLPFDPAALDGFSDVSLTGRMGDPTGVHRYRALAPETLDKWRATVSTPVRKRWCRKYLEWLGAERLAVMGYDQAQLLRDLDALEPSGGDTVQDVRDTVVSMTRGALRARLRSDGATPPWRSLLGA